MKIEQLCELFPRRVIREVTYERQADVFKKYRCVGHQALLILGLSLAAEEKVQGTIEQSDHGIVINADDGETCRVAGKDLSSMVAKTVKATGTLKPRRKNHHGHDGGRSPGAIPSRPRDVQNAGVETPVHIHSQ